MGTQLMKLNEAIHWILWVKIFSKVLKNHARWTTNKWTQAPKYQPKSLITGIKRTKQKDF
jgi:hypothetical protein